MTRYLMTCLVVLTLIYGSGCIHHRTFTTPSDSVYLLARYKDAIKLWTEQDEIHRNFIGVAKLCGTYRSWEVRQAYISAANDCMQSESASLQQIKQRELNRFNAGNEFTIGLYCYEKEWQTLMGLKPIWNITLFTDSVGPINPILIEKMDIPPDEKWLFYDTISHWGQLYRVVFPKTDSNNQPIIDKNTSSFELQCKSLLGTMILKWKLYQN